MPSYLEKYGHTLVTLAAIIAAFVGLVTINGNRLDAQDRLISQQFATVNQRLDTQDQRIDGLEAGMNQRLDRLIDEVSELRRLTVGISERVSRSEGEIDVIREQLRIADTPSP